ncbi:MAG: hypothetical protein LBR68_04485 [Lachnoclostridium sp.]|jgi:protein-tyrosine phosphatase|nr:hypothetical protein [Lachnoclostridium sp.]
MAERKKYVSVRKEWRFTMESYFDMHSHILPGLDDGAKSEEQMKQMFQIAQDEGIQYMVATPHFYPGRTNNKAGHINEIYKKSKLTAESMGITLYLGNEISYMNGITEALEKKEALTLAGSFYVLIEFFPDQAYADIYRGLRKLIEGGFRPIVAHVERYNRMFDKDKYFQELIEMGCLIQMNSVSVIGGPFDVQAKRCRKLIYNEYIHFLGSDCHNITGRSPLMKTAVNFLRKKKMPEDIIQNITGKNAQSIINTGKGE